MTPTFRGVVENGVLKLYNHTRYTKYLRGLNGVVYVTVRRLEKTKTGPQNRYYWGVIIKMISDYTGHSPEEVHEGLKHKFLLIDGFVSRSTMDLTTSEVEDYHQQIRTMMILDYNFYIPLPNDIEY
jgi:hypothetical protein